MKISFHSDFLDLSVEQTYYLPSIIYLAIFNKIRSEPLFERSLKDALKKEDLKFIEEETDIIKRKAVNFKLKPHTQIPLKSKLKSHKWFLVKDRDDNFYFFLIDRIIGQKLSFRFYEKIKGRFRNIKKNVQLSKQRKEFSIKINEIFDKVNEMSLNDNISSFSCFNSTLNSEFSLKHTCVSFEGKNQEKNKNSLNQILPQKNKELDEESHQKSDEKIKSDLKRINRENRILVFKIIFVFAFGFAVVLWILQYFVSNRQIYKAFKK
jgi:hypothetical protein